MALFQMKHKIHQPKPASLKAPIVFFLVALLGIPVSADGQAWSGILDSSRAVDWTHAGFTITEPGSQCSNQTGSYSPSGGDDAASINALVTGCTGGGYILLSAGTFAMSSTGLIMYAISNVVIRGQGPDKTKLIFTGSYNCYQGNYVCIYGNPYSSAGYVNGTGGAAAWTGDNGSA